MSVWVIGTVASGSGDLDRGDVRGKGEKEPATEEHVYASAPRSLHGAAACTAGGVDATRAEEGLGKGRSPGLVRSSRRG